MPLKPSDVTFGCVSSECSMDRAQLQGSKPSVCLGTVTGFSDWAVDGRRAQCTRLLIIPGVQTPGSRISLDRLRRYWNDTSFCLILILVASAVLAGWTKHLRCDCVYCMWPVLMN